MQIVFTRHGESEANILRIISNRDLPHRLTEQGRLQAISLADQLAASPVAALYASPILRAQETAEIVAERLGISFEIVDALREFDCGMKEGLGDADAWQAHQDVMAAWEGGNLSARIPGGESFEDMQNRFLPFIELLKAKHIAASGRVVLVSHGSLLHNMLPSIFNKIDRAFVSHHPLRNCDCVFAALDGDRFVCSQWGEVKLSVS